MQGSLRIINHPGQTITIGFRMSFIDRLVGLLREARRSDEEPIAPDLPDEQLAAAALLVHVARVDGVIAEGERRSLLSFLETSYGLDRASATALLARADRMDREVDDVGELVAMLGHEGHGLDGTRLLGVAYGIAVADGGLAEFEEDLLWRLGHLLRLDDAAIAAIRAENVAAGFVAAELRV